MRQSKSQVPVLQESKIPSLTARWMLHSMKVCRERAYSIMTSASQAAITNFSNSIHSFIQKEKGIAIYAVDMHLVLHVR